MKRTAELRENEPVGLCFLPLEDQQLAALKDGEHNPSDGASMDQVTATVAISPQEANPGDIGINQYLACVPGGQLDDGEREQLSAPITLDEIVAAIGLLATWKAAGTDIILLEFYKVFFQE
ncbi:hypothetical protein NDU88_001710 [Pleurodeles waltl]|uniref:Uncharacterized protein n=1 Tax=Pleurodeles waltl TaxID=8319 RepID=A0AAV7SDM7_PLEWA|nr:hypothetical protein NDU88_001710 [Pleurodeles waltl]